MPHFNCLNNLKKCVFALFFDFSNKLPKTHAPRYTDTHTHIHTYAHFTGIKILMLKQGSTPIPYGIHRD